MGYSNAGPEISYGERNPDNSSVTSIVPPFPNPFPILPVLEGQATLSRFIPSGEWGEFISLLPFFPPPVTKPTLTT